MLGANSILVVRQCQLVSEVTTWIHSPASGHLVEKNHPGETDNGTSDADYTYTPGGRLLTRTAERGITTTYGYNHVLMTSTDYSDNTPDVIITYEPLGRDKGWELKDDTTVENQAAHTYSATDGRIFQISNPQTPNLSFSYTYLPSSNLLATVSGPVHTVINQWDPTRDVLRIKQNKVGTDDSSEYDYFVNEIGQREKVVTSGTEFPTLPTWLWGYEPQMKADGHGFEKLLKNSSVTLRVKPPIDSTR